MPLTVATWNVNGIRARAAQFLEWVGRDRPDVICLQEIKALPDQIDATVCNLDGYWCYWHGAGPYSGVSLNLRRDVFPEEPRFAHHPRRSFQSRSPPRRKSSIKTPTP